MIINWNIGNIGMKNLNIEKINGDSVSFLIAFLCIDY